jgi:two-component system, chemotaxis family, response regulator Rcp1
MLTFERSLSDISVNPAWMSPVFHILMVEDDPASAQLLKYCCHDTRLRRYLHHVADGQEALSFLRKEGRYEHARTPDIVILDLNMPKMSGLDVLRAMKGDPQFRTIPVVIFSASLRPEDVEAAYDSGAACFINKPVGIDDMSRALEVSTRFWLTTATLPSKTFAIATQA